MGLNRVNLWADFTAKLSAVLKRPITLLLATMIIVVVLPVVAEARIPTPRVKPAALSQSQILSETDASLFEKAVKDAKRGNWSRVATARGKISNPVAKDALRWLRATRDPNTPLSELTYVLHNLEDWPRRNTVRARAEGKLLDSPMGIEDPIAWFKGNDPVSGEGRVALAREYYRRGMQEQGDRWLRYAWQESSLTRDRQKSIYKAYKNRLRPEDHAKRGDYLIWLGYRHYPKVEGLLSLMPANDRALQIARMKINRNASGMDAAIKAVPQSLLKNAGLLYERGRWRRRKASKEKALPMFTQITSPPFSTKGKEVIWRERKIMTYWAIEEKRFQDAYDLTLNHGLERGVAFAEAEFLGGWLALTKLGQPSRALEHFTKLKSGVGLPVSLSRAAYWQGRAAEAKNDPNARAYYSDAAQHVNTFFGQLAADKLGGSLSMLTLPPEPKADVFMSSYNSDPRVMAMKLFGEIGEERFYTQFSFHLDDDFTAPGELSLLAQTGREFGYMRPSVRAAKQAGRLQTMLTETGYPLIPAIEGLSSKFDKPFVYAIARQESEFNYNAVSSAKAYGMMQMINATARSTARRHRIPYDRSRMTIDIDYSATLGAYHLNDLLERYEGSYILTAAAYNAGPNRVARWLKAYGDPRNGEIDPIDWLESIPFSETRNYIQRVMENMQVYRARLNGGSTDNQSDRALRLGTG
jgi:soluble lytic murein transglycosylase